MNNCDPATRRSAPRVPRAPRQTGAARRWLRAIVLGIGIFVAAPQAGWAKGPANAPAAPAEKSYILPYILVGLCLAFGLMAVCRPASRSDKEKKSAKEEFEEGH